MVRQHMPLSLAEVRKYRQSRLTSRNVRRCVQEDRGDTSEDASPPVRRRPSSIRGCHICSHNPCTCAAISVCQRRCWDCGMCAGGCCHGRAWCVCNAQFYSTIPYRHWSDIPGPCDAHMRVIPRVAWPPPCAPAYTHMCMPTCASSHPYARIPPPTPLQLIPISYCNAHVYHN